MNIDFSFDCLIGSWHQGGFAKCYELKDLATGEVRNFLTKNWSCSSESEALLSRWRRERLCPSRCWPRVIKKRKCLRRSGLLKRIVEEGLNPVFARLHKGVSHAHLVKLFSYFEDSNFVYIVLELCRYCLHPYWWCIFPLSLGWCEISKLLVQQDMYKYCFLTEREVWWSCTRGVKLSQNLSRDILFTR